MLTGIPWKTVETRVLRLRNRHYLIFDAVMLPVAAYLAFVLRLESLDPGAYATAALVYVALAVVVKIPVFLGLGGYSRYWPFASLPELLIIVQAAALGELLSVGLELGCAWFLQYPAMPRSIPFIALFLTAASLATPRLGVRLLYGVAVRHGEGQKPQRRVLIVGAGEGGYGVLQEILRNPQLGLLAVGLIDDDPTKHGLRIQNVPVLGAVDEIPQLVREHRVQQVMVAIPTASGAQMRHIVDVCRKAEVKALTLPGIYELISGRVEVQRFRPIQVEDLLAREPVRTDTSQIHLLLTGKVVLVTGAGGSIGSELCRQIAQRRPAHLVLLGHGENSIYQIHQELSRTYPGLTLHPVIADTRDAARIHQVFERFRPVVVVHAAAHKHVPMMEANPEEAITTNVGGTRNLLRAAERFGVQTFVMISTDKAVHPTSTMGASKRIAEHLVQAAAHRTGCRFVAVRFGNVLGSRGSVVPLFQRQIEAGGPITVTHPKMERYFMTIPESVQLVLQSAALGRGGEVFVLDMGEPVKIVDLARDMIRLAGLREGEDIEIAFTGLRPGEKLYEELFLDDEHYQRTLHEKVFVSRNGKATDAGLEATVSRLLQAARTGDVVALYGLMRHLVPECEESLGACTLEDQETTAQEPALAR